MFDLHHPACKSIVRFLTTVRTLAHFLPGHTEQLFRKEEYPHTQTDLASKHIHGPAAGPAVLPHPWKMAARMPRLAEQDAGLGNGAELSQGKTSPPSNVWYSSVFLDAREGFPLLAVPLHGHVQPTCWAWSMSGQGCSGLMAAVGVEKGNVVKQRDLGKQTGYIC